MEMPLGHDDYPSSRQGVGPLEIWAQLMRPCEEGRDELSIM